MSRIYGSDARSNIAITHEIQQSGIYYIKLYTTLTTNVLHSQMRIALLLYILGLLVLLFNGQQMVE